MDVSRVAGVVLGLAFLWAGVAKLADRLWPESARAFGVPASVARLIGPLELILGAVLVTVPRPAVGACAFVLLVVYTGLIVGQLRSGGDAPPCACFGGVTARPVSWRTVLRNVGLLMLAALAFAG